MEIEGFAARLAQTFTALSLRVEDYILSEMISGGDAFCAYRFEVDAQTLRGLVTVFREDQRLWTDFHNAIQAHRQDRHWTALLEFVYEIGNLHGQLRILEQELTCPCPEERQRLVNHLNGLDGEIAARHVLADRRNLAERVNTTAGYPLIDGLSMRGLTFAVAEHPDLWRPLQGLVEGSVQNKEERTPRKDCCP